MAEFDHAAFAQQNVASHLNRRRQPEEAKFAKPEAAITALGVGAILGGPVGLAAGIAQGILGKRERQEVNDYLFAQQQAQDETSAAVQRSIAESITPDMSDKDFEQVQGLMSQAGVADKMMRSPDPAMQKAGAELMGKVLEADRAFRIQNEQQTIAAAQREEDAARQLGEQGYARYKDSRDNFTKESAPYLEVRNATVNLQNALGRGTAVDQYAAIKLLEKALDPASVVRPEEQEAWGNLGSIMDRADVYLEQLKSGKTLLPEQVRDIQNLAASIEQQSYEMQVARETRYADEITDIGLPEKYHNNFRLAEPLGAGSSPAPAAGTPGSAPDAGGTTAADVEKGVIKAAVAGGLLAKDVADRLPPEVKTGVAAATGTAGLMSAAKWAPRLARFAGAWGVPISIIVTAYNELGPQHAGESDAQYEKRLQENARTKEQMRNPNSPGPLLKRPTN